MCAAASGDIERVGLHILCHRTARRDIRAVSDLYRRNQIAVAADKDIVPDLRAIFVRAVIIDKDYAAAQIYTAADIRITDIGQVRGLRAVSEAGVFHFHKITDLTVRADRGMRPQISEWILTADL